MMIYIYTPFNGIGYQTKGCEMEVRDVYLLYTLFGFREISKEAYEKKLAKGYCHDVCSNELCEDRSIKWSIYICYPVIFSDDKVRDEFYKNYTMYTGIV